jgi:hypothetical protein
MSAWSSAPNKHRRSLWAERSQQRQASANRTNLWVVRICRPVIRAFHPRRPVQLVHLPHLPTDDITREPIAIDMSWLAVSRLVVP